MKPKVTVIIPTYNRAEYLAECLDSILCQTLQPCQVILINDGSDDWTRDVVEPYMMVIDYQKTNQVGKGAALNKGLEIVAGDYVWIFDDDDVALPDALERFVEPLELHPEVGFSYGTFYYSSSRPEDNQIGSILRESKIPDLQEKGFLIPLLEGDFIGGAALFARTSCYQLVGNFDPELIRSQDYEMTIRISRQFTGIRVQGGPLFHYRQHEGLRGSRRDRFQAPYRPMKWLKYDQIFFRKLYRDLPLVEYLPPGSSLEKNIRQAHLQRLEVMTSKLLIPEVMNELHELSQLSDRSDFSDQEQSILGTIINKVPYYRAGTIFDQLAFFDEIHHLSKTSILMRRLRKKILRLIVARLNVKHRWGNPHQIFGTIQRITHLFLIG